jgi:DNA polymerase
MGKKTELKQLKERMEADTSLPLRETATQIVFGEGAPEARLYFLGEAPGRFEDKLGRPFVGNSGKLLDKLLERIGTKRSDVYISNIVRFRPPDNRQPTPSEIAAFLPYVDREIEIIQPKLIVTLGRFSMAKFLPEVKISGVHGKLQTVMWQKKLLNILPLYHPAAALRSTRMRKALEEDFEKIPRIVHDIEKL